MFLERGRRQEPIVILPCMVYHKDTSMIVFMTAGELQSNHCSISDVELCEGQRNRTCMVAGDQACKTCPCYRVLDV